MTQIKSTIKFLVGSLTAVVSLIALSNFAYAQDAGQDGANSNALEEVIVTARKREESIQTVPIAVTALSGEQIERSFKFKVEGIDEMAPNVELGRMQFGGGGLTGAIRGISFAETERTFEPAVGLMVDGVNYGTGTGAMVTCSTSNRSKFFVALKAPCMVVIPWVARSTSYAAGQPESSEARSASDGAAIMRWN